MQVCLIDDLRLSAYVEGMKILWVKAQDDLRFLFVKTVQERLNGSKP